MEEFEYENLTQDSILDEVNKSFKLDSEDDLKNKRVRVNYVNKYLSRYALLKMLETIFLCLFSGSGLALGILTLTLGMVNVLNLVLLIILCISFISLLVSIILRAFCQRRLSIVNDVFKSAWKVTEEPEDALMRGNPLALLWVQLSHFEAMFNTVDGIKKELTLVGVRNANLLGRNIEPFLIYSVIVSFLGFSVLIIRIFKSIFGEITSIDMVWAILFIIFFTTIILAFVPLALASNSYFNFATKLYKKATKHIR